MKIDHLLMRGYVDPDIRVSYKYEFMIDNYPTITQPRDDFVKIMHSYSLQIMRTFDDSIFIGNKRYFPFVLMLEKTVKLVSDNLYNLFPDINDFEFGIDRKMLEIFQSEKAVSSAGITMVPCVWVKAATNECYPAIEVSGSNIKPFKIPLEDAMSMVKLFSVFDPVNMGMNMLRMLGKIE